MATDGDGADSPFTTALVKHLTTPGLDLRLALGKVRDDVLAATHRKQEPFVYGSLGGSTVALVVRAPARTSVTDAAPIAAAAAGRFGPGRARRAAISISPTLSGPRRPGMPSWYATRAAFSPTSRASNARKLAAPGAVAALPAAEADKAAASRSLGRFGGITIEIER